ncbi:carbohydrate-binding domain-containing protein [Acetobacterium wieringae]|uniref:carbohydrate-binding domain-containing protein n=1 Tax=Acetobacterium wieringae TaxID=52694 RepID=UPI0020346F50|nr:carbohydrate-binding domain-containing protein [Acetobacterium wieringae]URN83217.1 carbohydrate-binding domain-containing protein [Acetobacterium wieringae]
MKNTTIRVLSALTVMSMAFSGSVFAASDQTTDTNTSTLTTVASNMGVAYRGHIQNTGDYPLDNAWIQGPTELGTEGQGLRLEGFWIELTGTVPENAHIQYQVHVQNEGWMDWVSDGAFAGTRDKSQRIEAIRIRLVDDDGNALSGYSVQYRGHIQDQGDTEWVADGAELGTTGLSRRLEALEVQIIQTNADNSDSNNADSDDESSNDNATVEPTSPGSAIVSPTSTIVIDKEFSNREQNASYDESLATHAVFNGTDIELTGAGATAENGILTITAEGTYVVSGNLTEGQIRVETTDTEKVQLVLNGVTIHNSNSAPIYLKSADKVFITLAEGTTNTLTDGSDYIQTDDNTVDAVIFSKADLAINGTGTLNITANYKHGIVSKDDLIITGGTFNISSVKAALNGKDALKIKDGVFNISSSDGKGLTSKHDSDTTKGYVYIAGGTFKISNCTEGIEGTAIVIEGGDIDVTATDDGLNAASETSTDNATTETTETAQIPGGGQTPGGGGMMAADTNAYIAIAGGTIKLNTTGDGIDSNGNLYVSGGTIFVSGPTSDGEGALDYDGTANVSGGTIVIAGSSGMAQSFSNTSTQASILYNLTAKAAAGTEVSLKDSSGKVLVSYTPEKSYQSVVISTPEMSVGSTYTLTAGGQTVSIEQTAMVTSNGNTNTGGPGGTRPDGGNRPDPGTTPMTPPTETAV